MVEQKRVGNKDYHKFKREVEKTTMENKIKSGDMIKTDYGCIEKNISNNPEYGYKVLKVIEQLVPKDVVGKEDLVRVGNWEDGGYCMLDDLSNISCAYSIGIGSNYSWDLDISSRKINVYMFDPQIKPPDLTNRLLKFYGYGISLQDVPSQRMFTLESLIKLDNNSDKQNMILKMDVEGAEWNVFSKTQSSLLDRFTHIVVELHFFSEMIASEEKYQVLLSALENLNKTHQLIWVHGKTTTQTIIGGIPIPNEIEVAYVRRDEKLNFKEYNNRKKRMDVRNFKSFAESLVWWLEAKDIDFKSIQNSYKYAVRKDEKLSSIGSQSEKSAELQ